MKTNLKLKSLLLLAFLVMTSVVMDAQIWTEDFEVDGEGVTYTTTGTFNDGLSDHYGRTDGSDIDGGYMMPNNTFFFAGEDLDDLGSPSPTPEDTITFFPFSISGISSLQFSGLFADGSEIGFGTGNDAADFVSVEANIDGAGWSEILRFAGLIGMSNTGLFLDTTGDGFGDGAELSPTFAQFDVAIPGTGTNLELRVRTYANSGGEEFAFDFLRVFDASTLSSGCTDATAINYDPAAAIDDGSCYHISVDVFSFGFNPDPFTILTGQTVRWINLGGIHNVDGNMNAITFSPYSNPENFFLANGDTGTEWLYTFNVAGEYDYNCSIGSHAALGMVGSFTVGTGGCTNPAADNYDSLVEFDDGSCIISGCTDSTALNYDSTANNDDGSCIFTLPNLVINEIHYNPCATQGTDGDFEFLEIYNGDGAAVVLDDITLTYGTTLAFTFPLGSSIADGEYIIVAANALSYEGNGYQVFDLTSGGLGNGGTDVVLADALGNEIDAVSYSDGGSWPAAADGLCPTLELIDPTLDNSDPLNWQASYVDNGTPGAENSTQPPATPYTINQLQTELHEGEVALTGGIVTCVYPGSFTMQDGTGAFSGIWVIGTGAAVGDDVLVEGLVSEANTLTNLVLINLTINSSGNALPAHEVITTLAANDEQWEGVLVEATGVCNNNAIGFGEWSIDDGSGPAIADDLNGVDYSASAIIGVTYTVSGPLYFSFGTFKITPCDNATDIQKHGCTDSSASNYDADAMIDDGSCEISGCTYPLADNYNSSATIDDGSCTFDDLGSTCSGDADGDGLVNILDIVAVSSNFGAVCP